MDIGTLAVRRACLFSCRTDIRSHAPAHTRAKRYRPVHLNVSKRRFAHILAVLSSREASTDPGASAQTPTAAHVAEAALAEQHASEAHTEAFAAPRSSLRWLQIRRRKPLPAVRQRQRPCLRSCANIPDWESCATGPTPRGGSSRGSVVSSGQLERAASDRRAWLAAPMPPRHVAPPLPGLVGSQWDAAVRPLDGRPGPQPASEAVVTRGATRAGPHSKHDVRAERLRARSARSIAGSGTDSGMTSSGSTGASTPAGGCRSVSTVFVPTQQASTPESWQSKAAQDWREGNERFVQQHVSPSISVSGSIHAPRLVSGAAMQHERRMVSGPHDTVSSADNDGFDGAVKAARQDVSCSSSSDGGAGSAQRHISGRAMAASNFDRSPISSDSSTATAEGISAAVHHRTVAFAGQRASRSESSFSIGVSSTDAGTQSREPRQQAVNKRHGLVSLGSTGGSFPAAVPTPASLLSAPTADRDGRRRAAHSESEATDEAPSAARHAVKLAAPCRKRHARRRAAGTVSSRQLAVGYQGAATGRTGRWATDASHRTSSSVCLHSPASSSVDRAASVPSS